MSEYRDAVARSIAFSRQRHDFFARLHAVYISNFGCGPDSFIEHFFNQAMEGKVACQAVVRPPACGRIFQSKKQPRLLRCLCSAP